jgi:RHS repeat-associated protein
MGQHKIATFPKPNNISVKTTYTYDPPTARLKTLITQKLNGGTPTETYQNLHYQQFDGKGNLITLIDNLNSITHSHTYDALDRLLTAQGTGTNPYSQSYQYDRIGNIIYKSDIGNYSYTYFNKPHAVRTAGNISLQYDSNGNMTGRTNGTTNLNITYNYDNKPELIQKNGADYVRFTYDGNGERVKKYNYSTGQSVIYFGELYEVRAGLGTIHIFAGDKRVASVLSDGRTQFYHTNHLGSASVITDQNGDKKERMEYFPFGTYRESIDYDPNFPDVFYTFTGQEDDDELGLYNYGARLYDPLLGRFISADTIVPYPDAPKSLNRYTYCNNNPLIYVDPSGHGWFVFAVIAVIASAFFGAAKADTSGGSILKGALIGAAVGVGSVAAGYVGGVVLGPAVNSWLVANVGTVFNQTVGNIVMATAGEFAAGAVSSGLNTAVYGGNVWQSALYGGLYGAAIAGTIQGAIEFNNWANSRGFGGTGVPKKSLIEVDPNGVEYVNPTGGEIRGCDPQGCGTWGANREGGRLHPGIDLVSNPDQDIVAPFEGRVLLPKDYPTRIDIAGKNHFGMIYYAKPSEAVISAQPQGLRVSVGQIIGTALEIRGTLYPSNITNHIHFELYRYTPWDPINPTPFIFKGRWR